MQTQTPPAPQAPLAAHLALGTIRTANELKALKGKTSAPRFELRAASNDKHEPELFFVEGDGAQKCAYCLFRDSEALEGYKASVKEAPGFYMSDIVKVEGESQVWVWDGLNLVTLEIFNVKLTQGLVAVTLDLVTDYYLVSVRRCLPSLPGVTTARELKAPTTPRKTTAQARLHAQAAYLRQFVEFHQKRPGATVYLVPSRTSDAPHHATVAGDGTAVCSCPAFHFSGVCAHGLAAEAHHERDLQQRDLVQEIRYLTDCLEADYDGDFGEAEILTMLDEAQNKLDALTEWRMATVTRTGERTFSVRLTGRAVPIVVDLAALWALETERLSVEELASRLVWRRQERDALQAHLEQRERDGEGGTVRRLGGHIALLSGMIERDALALSGRGFGVEVGR